ncbi:MAG: lysine 2,3-aminomutase, partial [candidate division KSB1 bacterium]|nr:lysine 2,3-aminomutase [candidate division KSB1 bacterium]
YAVPTYVVDAPGGGGKIPVMPNYLMSMSDHKIVLRNFEGFMTTYEEPIDYKPHDTATCPYCQAKRPEPGQTGITGLLDGEHLFIEPKGFDETHARGGARHRLRSEDTHKWQPFGIGSETSPVIQIGQPRATANHELL